MDSNQPPQTIPPTTLTCLSCKTVTRADSYFCPNCGKKLRSKPLSTAFVSQLGVYFLSFFIPPFGLIPAFTYLRQEGRTAKTVGSIAIVLTVLSLLLIVVEIMYIINLLGPSFGTLSSLYGIQGL
jgi:hypothetical protein